MIHYFTNIALAHTEESAQGIHDSFAMSEMMGNFGWFFMILFWALVILGAIALIKYVAGNGEKKDSGSKIYMCSECEYEFNEKQWAEKCQKWCAEHHSCSLDIIRHGNPPKS